MKLTPLDLFLTAVLTLAFGTWWVLDELAEAGSLSGAWRAALPDLIAYPIALLLTYAAKNWWDDHRDPY